MPTTLVIEHLDVVEQALLRVRVTLEPLRLLALHGGEPALDHRVEAPMCQECCLGGRHDMAGPMIGEEPVVDLTRNEPL